jgi:hypothetical protein
MLKWPKRQKLEQEERRLPIDPLDRVTLLQSWDRDWDGEPRGGRSPSSPRGRYIRFGIGGAGNMRKSGFLFLETNHLVSQPTVDLTDTSFVDRIISHNGRNVRTIAS